MAIAPSGRLSSLGSWVIGAGVAGLVACGSAAPTARAPAPALADSQGAQVAYRRLESRWTDLPPERRTELEPALRDFLRRFATDDRARSVRLLLAWVEIDRGLMKDAHALSSQVRAGPPGAVHDFADVVDARAFLRERRFQDALRLLLPLRGKMVDPTVRGLYSEELVRCLVACAKFDDAIHAMLDWAEQAAPTERDDVVATIEGLIRAMPTAALEAGRAALAAEDRAEVSPERSSRSGPRRWLLTELRTRLTRVALTERDPDLARRLVESSPVDFGRDDARDALTALAATSAVAPRVSGRAIGVVLDVTDDAARRQSAEVVEGMSRALGLPAATEREDAVRLVTREASEPGDVERALAGLAGDGAAVLVGGVTADAAVACSVFAERAKLPVLVVAHPETPPAGSAFTFLLGADPSKEEAAIADALGHAGAHAPARVGPGGAPCDAVAASVAGSRFPIREWKQKDVDALVLLGAPECSRDVIDDVGDAGLSPLFVLGLESAQVPGGVVGRQLFIGAGRFPFAAHTLNADELAWVNRWGGAPSWYETLGHDAALLAATALADLPLERVVESRAVTALHERVRDALLHARAPLWSTAATGFDGGHALPRDLQSRPPLEAAR